MYLDNTIGDLVQYLEAEGWMENSIIVVASDNGGCPRHGGSNYPLRGTKYSYWEGGNKVSDVSKSASQTHKRWSSFTTYEFCFVCMTSFRKNISLSSLLREWNLPVRVIK